MVIIVVIVIVVAAVIAAVVAVVVNVPSPIFSIEYILLLIDLNYKPHLSFSFFSLSSLQNKTKLAWGWRGDEWWTKSISVTNLAMDIQVKKQRPWCCIVRLGRPA